jgi:hypothetical protein
VQNEAAKPHFKNSMNFLIDTVRARIFKKGTTLLANPSRTTIWTLGKPKPIRQDHYPLLVVAGDFESLPLIPTSLIPRSDPFVRAVNLFFTKVFETTKLSTTKRVHYQTNKGNSNE